MATSRPVRMASAHGPPPCRYCARSATRTAAELAPVVSSCLPSRTTNETLAASTPGTVVTARPTTTLQQAGQRFLREHQPCQLRPEGGQPGLTAPPGHRRAGSLRSPAENTAKYCCTHRTASCAKKKKEATKPAQGDRLPSVSLPKTRALLLNFNSSIGTLGAWLLFPNTTKPGCTAGRRQRGRPPERTGDRLPSNGVTDARIRPVCPELFRDFVLASSGVSRREWRPAPDPRALSIGIVHLGTGAFHRAHQAVYTQDALAAGGGTSWGICGVTQRSPAVAEALRPQDCLYSVLERRGESTEGRVIGVIRDVLVAQEQADALTDRLAVPTTRIVTLTVTEKGYRFDPSTGRLRGDDPDVRADAERPPAPDRDRPTGTRPRGAPAPWLTPGHGLVLRQPSPQRGHLSRLVREFCASCRPGSEADRLVPLDQRERVLSQTRWWTGSCPPPPTRTAARPRPCWAWRTAASWSPSPFRSG